MPAERAKNILLWFLRPFFARNREYWKVVALCFVAASTFWLLNALNKTYTNIRTAYPLKFVYDENKYIPLKPLPEEIDINVSGKGWKLLRKYLMIDVRPAEIVLYSIPRYDYLPGPALRSNVSGVLDGLQLNFIFTDTVHFSFDRRIRRKIPLVVDSVHIKTAENVAVASKVQIAPDSVLFDGPASIVGKFPHPFPVRLPVSGIDRSFKRFIPLEYPNKSLVTASVPDVEVSFAVSPLIWQEISLVPVIPKGLNQPRVTIQPETIMVRYGQGVNGKSLNPDLFEASVNLTTFNARDSTASVILTRRPALVKKTEMQPARVKVKIRR